MDNAELVEKCNLSQQNAVYAVLHQFKSTQLVGLQKMP